MKINKVFNIIETLILITILGMLTVLKPTLASATPAYTPSLDLAAAPASGFARELHEGNWLYTLAWAPARLVPTNKWLPEFHAGILQGWRASAGDPMTGILAGGSIRPVALIVQGANAALGIDSVWKPLGYIANATFLDGFAGYRFQHGPDVHSEVYGFNFELRLKFGDPEVKAGL